MGNLWWLLLVGLATVSISETILVSSQSLSTADDLYIEGQTSGDLPIDDEDAEDGGSGSGSGDYGFFSREFFQSQPTAHSPHNPPTTAARSQDPATTAKDTQTTRLIFPDGGNKDDEVPGVGPSTTNVPLSGTTAADDGVMDSNNDSLNDVTPIYEDTVKQSNDKGRSGTGLSDENSSLAISSENLLERKEVLTAVIACGVVGFLCAVFLLSLLAYRMKKKDEGSYNLGDNKLSATAYHKAPTKEFFA